MSMNSELSVCRSLNGALGLQGLLGSIRFGGTYSTWTRFFSARSLSGADPGCELGSVECCERSHIDFSFLPLPIHSSDVVATVICL